MYGYLFLRDLEKYTIATSTSTTIKTHQPACTPIKP
jgi:hypothetical protein